MKAIVVGAGIGGLTAALALRAVGVAAQVYERSDELREVGAGISLWPNAVKALRQLGLGEALAAASLESPDSALRRWDGKVLAWTRAKELRARFGGGVIALHREELLALLARELGENAIHLGCDCRQIEEGPDGVRVTFANGESATGDVVIGADGVRSVVRGWLGHSVPPRYSGYTAWRAVVEHPTAALTPGESWGRGRRFGFLPVGRDRVYWYATQNAPEGGQDAADGARAQLLELFKGWHEPVEALIGAATDASILRHDLYDHDPLGAWGRGRVTLLGDAAHAMTPNLGQGACQAMEDALELARALKAPRAANDAGAALREYESRRIARTTSIVLTSRRVGAMGQLESPVLCALRDLAFGLTPGRVSLKGIAPVVGYEGHLGD